MKKRELAVSKLQVSLEDKIILQDISLTVRPGEVHVIMGPNGSGKSTLASALMGHPSYSVRGKIVLDGQFLSNKTPDERARLGLFLAFQSPVAIPGVSVVSMLRESMRFREKIPKTEKPTVNPAFQKSGNFLTALTAEIRAAAGDLGIAKEFLTRGIHDGFSGGEKKKLEMLEALILKPSYAIFDEIDTGLDVDSLKIAAGGIARLSKNGTGILVVTHYRRITDYLPADRVHILVAGRLVRQGGRELISAVESKGYSQFAG